MEWNAADAMMAYFLVCVCELTGSRNLPMKRKTKCKLIFDDSC
jgi:hypothetical protein